MENIWLWPYIFLYDDSLSMMGTDAEMLDFFSAVTQSLALWRTEKDVAKGGIKEDGHRWVG